jgi:hypothetical protein
MQTDMASIICKLVTVFMHKQIQYTPLDGQLHNLHAHSTVVRRRSHFIARQLYELCEHIADD